MASPVSGDILAIDLAPARLREAASPALRETKQTLGDNKHMLTRKTLLFAIAPVVANWVTSGAIAQTPGMNRRQDRRGDRQDCRQQEGLVGADKRNCKQQGRQTRGG